MDREERSKIRKQGRLFQRLYDLFGAGGFGKVASETREATVLVDSGHIMACKMPVGNMGDALSTLMKDSGCGEDFKCPKIEQLDKAEYATYPMWCLLEALNALAIVDETVRVKCIKDFPIEIVGADSGIKFTIAPRIESGD